MKLSAGQTPRADQYCLVRGTDSEDGLVPNVLKSFKTYIMMRLFIKQSDILFFTFISKYTCSQIIVFSFKNHHTEMHEKPFDAILQYMDKSNLLSP